MVATLEEAQDGRSENTFGLSKPITQRSEKVGSDFPLISLGLLNMLREIRLLVGITQTHFNSIRLKRPRSGNSPT